MRGGGEGKTNPIYRETDGKKDNVPPPKRYSVVDSRSYKTQKIIIIIKRKRNETVRLKTRVYVYEILYEERREKKKKKTFAKEA